MSTAEIFIQQAKHERKLLLLQNGGKIFQVYEFTLNFIYHTKCKAVSYYYLVWYCLYTILNVKKSSITI